MLSFGLVTDAVTDVVDGGIDTTVSTRDRLLSLQTSGVHDQAQPPGLLL